jgi:hypothetical protein
METIMQVKSIISVLAISMTMAVAGPAFAQTSINGTEISADDLPKVQERCNEITTASGAETLESQGDATNTATTGGSDTTKDDSGTADDTANATTTFDLDTLDAASCAQLTAK